MAGNNLKTIVTADTSGFKKGMKESKAALNDFQKQGESALSGISSALGDTSGAFGTLTRNIRNATTLFGDMASQGGTAITGLERSTIALKGALAGLGITAAINGFQELNRMAEIFSNTVAGANLELQAQAYRDTFRMAMEDQLGQGASWQKTKNGFKRALTEIGSTAGGIFNATIESGLQSMYSFEGAGAGLQRLADSWQRVWDAAGVSVEKGSAAAQYQGELNRALDQRLQKTVEWQRLSRQIAENERIAADTSLSQSERQAAVSEAMRLTTELSSQQEASAREIYRWTQLVSDEASDSKEETRQVVMAEAEVDRILGEQETKMRSLERLQNRINKNAGAGSGTAKTSVQAYESALEQVVGKTMAAQLDAAIMNEMIRNDVDVQRIFNEGYAEMMKKVPSLQSEAFSLQAPVTLVPRFDTQEWTDISNEVAGIIEDALTSVGDSVGQLIGDLATGGDAWGNFTNNAIQAFGDMAVTIGKMAVATGMATLGIKAALESLNPYVAIAAGTALIALGAAVRAGLSNVASGNYSTSVASSSYSSTGTYGQTSFGREMEVKVSGTLTANGSQLVAVLNNENDRKNYTT